MMNCQESPFRRRKNFCLKISSLTRHLPIRAGIILARRPDWKPRTLRKPLSRAAGAIERFLATRYLRRVYALELQQLNDFALTRRAVPA